MDPTTRPALVEHLDAIQRPGHGWAHGVDIVKRQTKVVDGVEFLALTLADKHNGERERLYLTGDGFEVSPIVGSYGDGIRWAVSVWDRDRKGMVRDWAKRVQPGAASTHQDVQFISNLSRAAEIIRGAREVAAR